MATDRLTLDATRTTLEIQTRAEGALSALAHDLSLRATQLTGDAIPGAEASAALRIQVDGIAVRGVLHGEQLDERAPPAFERREIEKRIRQDVFRRVPTLEVQATARDGQCRAEIRWGGERTAVEFPLRLASRDDGSWSASGRAGLSLAALGIKPIVGPLRAFRVVDRVEVRFDAVFVPASVPSV